MIATRLLLVAAAALLGDAPPAPRDFALRAGTLYPGDGKPLKNALVVVRDGRIESVREGESAVPPGLPLIDRSDAVVVPGFVAAETSLSDAFEERTRGFVIGTLITFRNVDPTRRAVEGFSFFERRDALLAGGVTTVYLAPGRARLVNGRGAVVKLAGASPEARTLRGAADLSLSLGTDAENPPGKFEAPLPPSAENFLKPTEPQMPRTRAGGVYAMREAFESAIEHGKSWRATGDPAKRPPFDPELLVLADLLGAKQPVRVRTSADADVLAALALLKDYGLKGALVGAAEADSYAARLKEADVAAIVELPVNLGGPPADAIPRDEPPRPRADTAAALVAAGVRVALAPADDAALASFPLLLAAGARAGLSRPELVRATTAEAARILGVADRVGALAAGRDADLVVLNGEPGEPTTTVRETYVSGERVFDRDDFERRRAATLREQRSKYAVPADGGSLVIRAGLVLPMSGDPIPGGSVAISNGKIVGVGRDVDVPRGARVLDAGADAVVTPGLIDARSFLGLGPDRAVFAGNAALEFLAVPTDPDFRYVAGGGVTTVLLQSPGFVPTGSPVAALKTGGVASRAVIREACGVGLPSLGANPEAYRAILNRGKQYSERWDKYFADSDKEKADAKKAAAEGKKPEEKPEAKKDEKPEPEKAAEDPLTGTWEGEVRGGPLPTPQPFTLRLRLKGDQVSGSLSSRGLPGGRDQEFEGGTFKDGTLTVRIVRPEIPFPVTIEAKIDRADHMTGSVSVATLRLEFDATRTEKAAPTMAARPRGKKKGVEMPPVDDNLEPFRRLMHGDATLLVAADTADDIRAVVAVAVDEFKLPLVILGGAQALDLAPMLAAKKVGLLPAPGFATSPSGLGLPVVAECAAVGVPVAIGSWAGTGGRDLREVGAYATSRGFGGDEVLRALTVSTAALFRIDGRVGSLTPGKDGDVVIWSGHPFRGNARPRAVVVGGVVAFEDKEGVR